MWRSTVLYSIWFHSFDFIPVIHFYFQSLVMPYISSEALIGAALVVVLAVGYQYMPTSGSDVAGTAKKNNKKKNKKKSKAAGEVASSVPPSEVESDATASKKKGKGKAKAVKSTAAPASPAPAPATPDQQSSDSESTSAPSFAAAASKSAPTKPRLLAEKILPKPRKTKVDE